MIDSRHDFRLVIRGLLRAPSFTVAAVTTLTLGIGANAAIFSAVESVLLRPLPVHDLDRIVAIESDMPTVALHHLRIPPAEVRDLAAKTQVFDAVAAYRDEAVNLTGAGEPDRLAAASTLGDFFRVFGVQPFLGRFYDSTDVISGATHVVVLSHGAWAQLTGGDRHAIGRPLRLNDESYQIIGVLPPGFRYPREAQVWTPQPLDFGVAPNARDMMTVTAVGRLREGVTRAQTDAALRTLRDELMRQYPQLYAPNRPRYFAAVPLADALAGQLRPILWLLVGAVGFVLLIACANVASLQLVRTIGRARELAVRGALGASRTTLAQWLLVEALVIASLGAGLGLLVADAVIHYARRSGAPELSMLQDLRLDPLVLSVSAVVTILAATFFGIVPALRAWGVNPADALRANTARGGSSGASQNKFLRAVIVVQFALALVLLLGSAVALRSIDRLVHVDPGFRADGLLAIGVALPESRYASPSAKVDFHNLVLERLGASSAIQSAASVTGAPFVSVREIEHGTSVNVVGHDPRDPGVQVHYWVVGGDYFRTMGIPLRAGRAFLPADNQSGPRHVIIDELVARMLFPGQNAVGKELDHGTVVGVGGAVKKADLAAPLRGSLYVPAGRNGLSLGEFTILIRTDRPREAGSVLRGVIRAADPTIPIPAVTTMRDAIDRSLGARRLASDVMAAFAALAVVLAVIGIYGVVSYATSQQTKEFGIRLALGSSPAGIVRMVLVRGAALAAAGIGAGLAIFLLGSGVLSSLAYGVSSRDPLVASGAAVMLAVVGIVAVAVPAYRAGRVDPNTVLRTE